MSGEPTFRRDLYRGTAPDYDRFRLPYPATLLEDLRRRAGLGSADLRGGRRLLDLAAGTGQIALALASSFDQVWAVDQEAESVAFGRAKASALGLGNVQWVGATAEEVAVDGPFDLVTIGNAFHRVRRDLVAARVASWLAPGRCLALLWGGLPSRGDEPWQAELSAVLEGWMEQIGATDRIPAGWQEAIDRDPHSEVLGRAGLAYLGEFSFTVDHDWSTEELAGFAYSTSFLNRATLGDRVAAFEKDLTERLLAFEPSGVFHQAVSFAYELARRPV